MNKEKARKRYTDINCGKGVTKCDFCTKQFRDWIIYSEIIVTYWCSMLKKNYHLALEVAIHIFRSIFFYTCLHINKYRQTFPLNFFVRWKCFTALTLNIGFISSKECVVKIFFFFSTGELPPDHEFFTWLFVFTVLDFPSYSFYCFVLSPNSLICFPQT